MVELSFAWGQLRLLIRILLVLISMVVWNCRQRIVLQVLLVDLLLLKVVRLLSEVKTIGGRLVLSVDTSISLYW